MERPTATPTEDIEGLRKRLAEAEELLRAIRAGDVDALVVDSGLAPAVYTLKGAADPYRLLVEQMSEGALTLSSEGVILYCNAAFAQMIRKPRERLIGGLFSELVVGEVDKARLPRLLARIADGGVELQFKTVDGERVHAYVSSTPLTVDGKSLHCFVVTNLSRQKLRFLHEAIVNSSQDAIFSLKVDGTVASWNAAAEQLYGYAAHQAIGNNIVKLIPLDQCEEAKRGLELAALGNTTRFNSYCVPRSGGRVDVSVGMSPISAGSRGVGAIAVIARDITERKLAEVQIKLLMRETDHRAKNLLSVVQAIAKLSALRAEPKFFAEQFHERLVALSECHNLLAQTMWVGVDLGELAHRHLDCYMSPPEVRVAIKGPPLLLTDKSAQAIGMALHELATNASKYGALSSASGKLKVEWEILGENLALRWKETGGPAPITPISRGFGYTVIVEIIKHTLEGSVRLEFPPSGCSWEILAPLNQVVASPQSAAVDAAENAALERRASKSVVRLSVLVVDDDPAVAHSMITSLQLEGYEVRSAADMEEALGIFVEFRPQIVLLDIGLPRHDGYEAARQIRRLTGGAGVKLIAVSGYGGEATLRRGQDAGFDAHLVKPVHMDQLFALLGQMTRKTD